MLHRELAGSDLEAVEKLFQASPWLTPLRLAKLGVGTAVVCFTPLALRLADVEPALGAATAVVVMTTLLLSLVLVRLAVRSDGASVRWCVFGGPCFGALNAGCALAALGLTKEPLLALVLVPFVVPLGSVLGIVHWGGPLGLAYGIAYLVPVCSAVRARQMPSHDSVDCVLRATGAWLVGLAIPGMLLGWWLAASGFRTAGWGHALTSTEVYVAAGLATLALPLGIAGWSVGTLRRRARRRFVELVRQGRVLGWQIAPIEPHDDLPLPLEPEKPGQRAGLLVRAPCREGAYRVRADRVVVARVPRRPSSAAIRNLPAIRAA
jgi:hypothetical protein